MEQMAAMASGAQMAQRGAAMAHQGKVAVDNAGGAYTVGGAATVGAVAGAVLMGPITAVAAGAAAAYATTRKDSVGEVARGAGDAATAAASGLKKFNDEHKITSKVYDAGVAATAKAKEVNAKYDITGKLTAGAKTAYQKGAEFEKRNDVSRRVGGAISSGLTAFTKAVGGSTAGSQKTLPSVPK
jgi:hypothetical protein